MINNKKKSRIRYSSRQKISKSNKKYKQKNDDIIKKLKFFKSTKTLSSQKKLEHSRKKFIKQHKNLSQKISSKKSIRTSSKKRNDTTQNKIQLKKSETDKSLLKLSNKTKIRIKQESFKGRNHGKQLQHKKQSSKKIYMPNDEYYGKKQEFLCAANTQQTLNQSSRAFFSRYTKLVNKIKSLQSLHKNEYDDFRGKLDQHQLMRLIKIQSLQRGKVEHRLISYIQKN